MQLLQPIQLSRAAPELRDDSKELRIMIAVRIDKPKNFFIVLV